MQRNLIGVTPGASVGAGNMTAQTKNKAYATLAAQYTLKGHELIQGNPEDGAAASYAVRFREQAEQVHHEAAATEATLLWSKSTTAASDHPYLAPDTTEAAPGAPTEPKSTQGRRRNVRRVKVAGTRDTTPALALVAHKGEARVDSRLLATGLCNKHKNVIELIERYSDDLQRFGVLPFQTEQPPNDKGGRPQKFALLNEDQSFFLLALSRNSDHVVKLKANLVMSFKQARACQDLTANEYLPGYHQLHDRAQELAAAATNPRCFHMNLNKLVNKAVGVAAGQRSIAGATTRSLLVVANTLAAKAMEDSKDHREGYQAAKKVLDGLGQLLIGGSA
ncbi:Rha family transcriptional regulator [Variovorax sp. J22R115]|uniref:Rha family transcriptional regulator n=1 Tax=Variovorax sp. J22R115 TaxID=3053509 RepID=UPI0025786630|nr:Rha family transcriptional regulator [Variovorax sp. J22R115]MDM0053667.1 Rha family transcriptional regulator [Variovorax sp. J22R115]